MGINHKKITISEFGVGSTLRVCRLLKKNFTKIQQHISALIVKLVIVV